MINCKGNDCLRVQDVKELLLTLDNYMATYGLDCVSVVADGEIARQLLYHAINDDNYNIGQVDLDRYNQGDAYIITLDLDTDVDREVVIIKAKGESDKYLATGTDTFIQSDLPCKDKYIEDVKNNKYIDGFKPIFFRIGKLKDADCLFDYYNRYEDNTKYGEISVSSNIADFIDLVSTFFEEYFGI